MSFCPRALLPAEVTRGEGPEPLAVHKGPTDKDDEQPRMSLLIQPVTRNRNANYQGFHPKSHLGIFKRQECDLEK